jgi:hypothetical protein
MMDAMFAHGPGQGVILAMLMGTKFGQQLRLVLSGELHHLGGVIFLEAIQAIQSDSLRTIKRDLHAMVLNPSQSGHIITVPCLGVS